MSLAGSAGTTTATADATVALKANSAATSLAACISWGMFGVV
jgi:hypothetical protein